MSGSLEPTHKDLQSALAIARSMTPRSPEERERRDELQNRIIVLSTQMRSAAVNVFEGAQREQEAFDLKVEAIHLAHEMHRPNTVLMSHDCTRLPPSAIEIDGDWILQPYGKGTMAVTIPSGTKLFLRTLCQSVVVLTFPDGSQVRFGLSEGEFPPDGIPVRAMPVPLESAE